MKKLFLSITALGLILFCGLILATSEKTSTQIAEDALASTVKLDIKHRSGKSKSSGFLVAPGRVATNLHSFIQQAKTGDAITGTAKLFGKTDPVDIGGYTAVNVKHDLIILDIPDLKAPSLRLGDSEDVKIGETVYAVGNPKGFEGTFSEGNISGIREDDNGKLLQFTAPISPETESSGGPVLNKKGEVIGVSVTGGEGAELNVNWAIPVNDLKHLLEKQFRSPRKLSKDEFTVIKSAGFEWLDSDYPSYKFSLENISRQTAIDIYCLAIFFDENQKIIGMDHIKIPERLDAQKKEVVTRHSIFTVMESVKSEKINVERLGALARRVVNNTKKEKNGLDPMDSYNFLSPDVRQMSGRQRNSIIILGYAYTMTNTFNARIRHP